MIVVDVLQQCLRAEQAALYAYGLIGGVLRTHDGSAAELSLAAEGYAAHRNSRDDLTEMVRRRGAVPAAAELAYEPGFPVHDRVSCLRLGRLVEERCATAYAYAVSQTVDHLRGITARGLTAASVRAVEWGAPEVPFPGLPER